MPYITQEQRQKLDKDPLSWTTQGELNYLISKRLNLEIQKHGLSYTTIDYIMHILEDIIVNHKNVALMYEMRIRLPNDLYSDILKLLKLNARSTVLGTLRCAQLEFYRRVAAPYEDSKIQENGDVYD